MVCPSRSPITRIAYLLLLASSLCAAAYYGAIALSRTLSRSDTQPTEIGDEWLSVAADELNLGRVYETDSYEHIFHIKNRGDRPVTITRFEKTCDCLGIEPEADVTLQPQESKPFAIKLSLVSRDTAWAPAGEAFQVRFGALYRVDDGAQKSTNWSWRLNSVIVPTIRLSPTVIQLGTQSDRVPVLEQSVVIEAAEEILRIDCEAPQQWSVEAIEDKEGIASNGFRLTVRSQGKLGLRKVSDDIRLIPVDHYGGRLPAKTLKVVGEIIPDVVVLPGEIHHGRQLVGAVVEEAIRLVSLTNRHFRIKDVTAEAENLAVTRISSDESIYSLRLRVTKTGEHQVEAKFVIRDDEGTEFTITASVRYDGVPSWRKRTHILNQKKGPN